MDKPTFKDIISKYQHNMVDEVFKELIKPETKKLQGAELNEFFQEWTLGWLITNLEKRIKLGNDYVGSLAFSTKSDEHKAKCEAELKSLIEDLNNKRIYQAREKTCIPPK